MPQLSLPLHTISLPAEPWLNSLGERIGCLGHNKTLDWWGQEEWFQFTAGQRESQLIWKTPHGHSRMLSVCLWGTNRVEILDWQRGYSQTSGEPDDRSRFKVFKSSEWMLAFLMIYALSELFAGLIAALLPKSRSICVWPVVISRDGLVSWGACNGFSMHISIVRLFGKIQFHVYPILSPQAEYSGIISQLLRNTTLKMSQSGFLGPTFISQLAIDIVHDTQIWFSTITTVKRSFVFYRLFPWLYD